MSLLFKTVQKRVIFSIVIIVLGVLFSISSRGQVTFGSISGIVQDSSGKKLEHAAVTVKGSNLSAITDSKGSFTLNSIPSGNAVLAILKVGFRPLEKSIEIVGGETNVITNLVLSEDIHELDEVEIIIGRQKFAKAESDQVARMPLKNMENPQVYNVVGKELMKEQVVMERSDMYRNIPGAVPNFSAGGSQGLNIRGFSNTNGLRNGMVTSAIFLLNPIILERLEVLRGPSGTLFGSNRNTSFGGVYNYVTKKPYETQGGELTMTVGSYNLSRVTADINTPLNEKKNVLFRLNTAWQSEGSFQDQGFAKIYTIAPSFTYKVNDKLEFIVDADFTRGNYTNLSTAIGNMTNVKVRNFKDFKLPYNRSLINNSADIENGVNNVQGRMEYKFSDKWKSQTNFLYSEGYYKDFIWTTLSYITDSTVIRQFRNQTPETFGNIQAQQNFVGDFKIGPFRNRVVIGFDYNKNYNSLNRTAMTNYDTININKPVKDYSADKINEISSKRGFSATTFKSESFGAYISDALNFTPNLMVMLSLRIDKYSTKGNYDLATGKYSGTYEQVSLSPKLGLVYQLVQDKVTLFTNYMNGFVNLGPVTQPDNTVLVLNPQYANQLEAGVKFDAIKNKLAGSISLYDISVKNSTRIDVINGKNFTVQDGTQRSKGYELELIANPVKGLNIIAGYANNENKYTKASVAIENKYVTASPKHVGNLWVSYTIFNGVLEGVGLGLGGNYVGESWFESSNSFVLPSYTLLNASVFYERPKYRITLKGNNLLNEHYWNPTGTPQKPINFLASVAYKF
ncbi:TonB-dependent receptor [Sporocytophaga myxococcoides]|uniref:TonB-dependent receptor n=1 Tax=Sporocytophaga myxococcoides TaxID=153721 RepID=UPI000414CE02|nr:TonB-dependent receptor [Sporocytophaga myxococcoides]